MLPGWIDYPLQETVANQFALPTFVLNDGHAATLAEVHLGAGQGYSSVLCIAIGTGLGGGVAIDGRIQHGSNGLAGSIGQMKLSLDGKTYMPLETLVSGSGLATLYNEQALKPVNSGKEVAERAKDGDVVAQDVIKSAGQWLGLALSHALHMFDVECVVMAGSVAQIGVLLFDATKRSLARHGHSTITQTPILAAKFGADAGLVGAALYASSKLQS